MVNKVSRRTVALALLVGSVAFLSNPSFGHWFDIRPVTNPVTVNGPVISQPATTQQSTVTAWYCVREGGQQDGGPFTSSALGEAPCGQLVAADGARRFLEERVTRTTTTTQVSSQTVSTRRSEVYGSTELRISEAAAQLLVRNGPNGSEGPASPRCGLTTEILARIEWTHSSGAWGPPMAVECAELPTTTTQVTVSSLAALQAALGGTNSDCDFMNTGSDATNNVRITLDTSVADPSTNVCVFGDDVEIIIPTGVVGPAIEFKGSPNRFRIGTPTRGSCSGGGRVGQLYGAANNVTVEGVDTNGDGAFNGSPEGHSAWRPGGNRWVVNCVATVSEAFCWLGGVSHAVIVDSNFLCGALTRTQLNAIGLSGTPGQWGFRNSEGPVVFLRTVWQNDLYTTIRNHTTDGSNEYFAAIDSYVVPLAEGRAHWAWPDASTGSLGPGQAYIIDGGGIFGYTDGCGWPEILVVDGPGNVDRAVDYLRVSNVDFRSAGDINYDQAFLNAVETDLESRGGTADVDSANGNTFSEWTSYSPPWSLANSSGDPTTLPLPSGLSISYSDNQGCAATGFPDV